MLITINRLVGCRHLAKGNRDIYGIEMTDEDHRELAAVHQCKAKMVLSGYVSPLDEECTAIGELSTLSWPTMRRAAN